MLANMQRVPRSQTRIRVAIPRVNPGSEPVQPPHLAGGWWVDRGGHTDTTHTYKHVASGDMRSSRFIADFTEFLPGQYCMHKLCTIHQRRTV